MNIELLPDSYRTAIESMVRLVGLSPGILAAICEPQVLFLTEEYRNAPDRVTDRLGMINYSYLWPIAQGTA